MRQSKPTGQKTYWHLLANRRLPSEYEITSTRLLYHPDLGLACKVPFTDWYQGCRERAKLNLASDILANFADPKATTYSQYVERRRNQEVFVNGILQSMDTVYDGELSESWLTVLETFLAPLRFPLHGMQMLAAYCGQMAPASRLAMVALFQAADEMRRLQHIAYRVRQLQNCQVQFAAASRELWQREPAWQPLRRLVENLLVTYDWQEAFVAVNLVLKPLFDGLLASYFVDLALASGDFLLPEIIGSWADDSLWQREWSLELLKVIIAGCPENQAVLRGWIDKWSPAAEAALTGLSPLFAAIPTPKSLSATLSDMTIVGADLL